MLNVHSIDRSWPGSPGVCSRTLPGGCCVDMLRRGLDASRRCEERAKSVHIVHWIADALVSRGILREDCVLRKARVERVAIGALRGDLRAGREVRSH